MVLRTNDKSKTDSCVYPMVSTRIVSIAVLGAMLALGSSCRKAPAAKTEPQAVAPAPVLKAAEQLTGAPAVMAALEKKDYDAAVGGLMAVGQAASSDQEKVSFLVLKREVQMKLAAPAQTDPKAAEALMALQRMTTGR